MSRTDGAFEASEASEASEVSEASEASEAFEDTDGRGTTVVDTPPRPLADLAPGARARVIRVVTDQEPAVVRRLHDLGFTPGTVVEVVRRAPLRDPVLYRVRDYEVCLRRAQARCVLVGEAER